MSKSKPKKIKMPKDMRWGGPVPPLQRAIARIENVEEDIEQNLTEPHIIRLRIDIAEDALKEVGEEVWWNWDVDVLALQERLGVCKDKVDVLTENYTGYY